MLRCICISLFLLPSFVFGQSYGIGLHSPAEYALERLYIAGAGREGFSSGLRPYTRRDVQAFAQQVSRQPELYASRGLRRDLDYLNAVSAAYRDSANTPSLFSAPFQWRIRPLLQLQSGQNRADTTQAIFNHRFGAELSAEIGSKIDFYANYVVSRAAFPNFVDQWIAQYEAVPQAGSFSTYRDRLYNRDGARRFGVPIAHLGVQATRHISLRAGYARHFIGSGYRSLILSDAGAPMAFFKINTRVWKFEYQNLFVQLRPFAAEQAGEGINKKKYIAAHYLRLNFSKKFSVGLYEATVLSRNNHFELQYLNPVILYRSVEGQIGSPDNVLLGLDAHWNIGNRCQLYAQFMLDEFLFAELRDWQGWWGNKFAMQAGAKYINAFGIDHLDLQVEYNRIRPYMYSHFDSLNSYTHYNQPLAHSLGANFGEFIGIVRWQPHARFLLSARYLHIVSGDDVDNRNFGTNPILTYTSRPRDFGNYVGQGIPATTQIFAFDASWMLKQHLFIDLKALIRQKRSREAARNLDTRLWSIGLRYLIWTAPDAL